MPSPVCTAGTSFTTMHNNVVTIKDKSRMLSRISYVDGSLVITDQQRFRVPPTISGPSNGVYTITLQAGRQGNKGVANTFNNDCGGGSKEYAPSGGGSVPNELNFLFAVELFFQFGGSVTVYVAQGHYFPFDNWWIGGAPIFSLDTPRLEYTFRNSTYTLALSGDHETFNLEFSGKRHASPIQNVFVLMLENHSFDNMFALSGIPSIHAATTSDSNSHNGKTFYVEGDAPNRMPTDPGHEFPDVVEQLAGKGTVYPAYGQYPPINLSGFAANYATSITEGLPSPPLAADIGDIVKCFSTESQLPVLHHLATEFVICDHWFSSFPGPTWPNRFFLHGASSNGLDHSPTSREMEEWESVDGFKYPHGSIFERMNAKGITWRLYHDTSGPVEGTVSQVSALQNIELWDVHELSGFDSDVRSSSYPYQYTFIEPNYGDVVSGTYENGSSQHPMDSVTNGENLIKNVYESIRNSPLWMSSMLIVLYDEHGGFYDHYAPVAAPSPNDGSCSSQYNQYGFTFEQYGVRVPAVIISPSLLKKVDHTIYDHTSVLATLDWLFGLGHLTSRDTNANVIQGVVLSAAPRTDCPTKLNPPTPQSEKRSPTAEERAARELEPVPDGSTLMGVLGLLLKADRKLSATPESRAAAITKFRSIKTRGDARAYLHEVMAKVQAERARRCSNCLTGSGRTSQ